MKLKLSKRGKIELTVFLVVYIIVGVLNAVYFLKSEPGEALGNVANKWILTFGEQKSFFNSINPMTLISSAMVTVFLIYFAYTVYKGFSIVPNRKQSFMESLMEFIYDIVESSIPDERYVRPVFMLSMTLFLYIALANLLGGFIPGMTAEADANGKLLKIVFFNDTWYAPTADLNTNLTYAVLVFLISHYMGIKVKGFKSWLKSWIEPIPIFLPMNIIGELAKPVSHSFRLFGNIMGGAILVFVLSYLTKYMFLPIFLWGYFGIFSGLIQAFVFTILTVAYISSQIS